MTTLAKAQSLLLTGCYIRYLQVNQNVCNYSPGPEPSRVLTLWEMAPLQYPATPPNTAGLPGAGCGLDATTVSSSSITTSSSTTSSSPCFHSSRSLIHLVKFSSIRLQQAGVIMDCQECAPLRGDVYTNSCIGPAHCGPARHAASATAAAAIMRLFIWFCVIFWKLPLST